MGLLYSNSCFARALMRKKSNDLRYLTKMLDPKVKCNDNENDSSLYFIKDLYEKNCISHAANRHLDFRCL